MRERERERYIYIFVIYCIFRTSNGRLCDWSKLGLDGKVHDSCRLFADEGIAKNVFQCIDSQVWSVRAVTRVLYSSRSESVRDVL